MKREISPEESLVYIVRERDRLFQGHLGFYYWKRGFHPVWIDKNDDTMRILEKVKQMQKDETL